MFKGERYRTATGKYDKLSSDNTTKLGKIIVSANRNRGIGLRVPESGNRKTGPEIPGDGNPAQGSRLGNPELGSEDAFHDYDTMFNYIRIWSNLIQTSAIVMANRVDMPKTLRIFVL